MGRKIRDMSKHDNHWRFALGKITCHVQVLSSFKHTPRNRSLKLLISFCQIPGGKNHERNWLTSKLKGLIDEPFEPVEVSSGTYTILSFLFFLWMTQTYNAKQPIVYFIACFSMISLIHSLVFLKKKREQFTFLIHYGVLQLLNIVLIDFPQKMCWFLLFTNFCTTNQCKQ